MINSYQNCKANHSKKVSSFEFYLSEILLASYRALCIILMSHLHFKPGEGQTHLHLILDLSLYFSWVFSHPPGPPSVQQVQGGPGDEEEGDGVWEVDLHLLVISTKMNYNSNLPRICWQLGLSRPIKITNSNSKSWPAQNGIYESKVKHLPLPPPNSRPGW